MILDQEKFERIKMILKSNPRGQTILEISKKLNMNRNSVAKYLEVLRISGQVEMETIGAAKVFVITHRLPISALMKISSNLIAMLDSDLRFIHINDNFLSFFNEQRQHLIGTRLGDIQLPPLAQIPIDAIVLETAQKGEIIKDLSFFKDGREVFFKIKYVSTVFDDGESGTTLLIEDMTRQKQSERNLQLSEARYHAIVEDQNELICRRKPDGKISFVNEAFCLYFSKKPEELLGNKFYPLILAEEHNLGRDELVSMVNKRPVSNYEQKIEMNDGQTRWLEWAERAIFNENNEILEYQLVGRDITGRKNAERDLHIRDTTISSSINGVMIVNLKGYLTYVNPSLLKIFQYQSINDILGKKLSVLGSDFAKITPSLDQIFKKFRENGTWIGQIGVQYKEGLTKYFQVLANKVLNEKGEHLCTMASFVDITNQKKMEGAYKAIYHNLQETIEFIPDPTYIIDENKNVIAWNKAIESLTGISRERILGTQNYKKAFRFYGDTRPVLIDLVQLPIEEIVQRYPAVRRFGNSVFIESFIPSLNNGKGAYLWGKANPLVDYNDNYIGAIETIRDITEWKKISEIRRMPLK